MVQTQRTVGLGEDMFDLQAPESSALFQDPKPGLRTWRAMITIRDPHRATTGHLADLPTCCVTPSSPRPLWYTANVRYTANF